MEKIEQSTYTYCYTTPYGIATIGTTGNGISHLLFGACSINNATEKETPLHQKAHQQLEEYFNGKRKAFDLPLNPSGTEFQKKVWIALREIPYGEVKTYKEIAEKVGSPKGYRAVGLANNKNPVAIIHPCHRVVGSDRSLVGYAYGLDMKKGLLELEGATV